MSGASYFAMKLQATDAVYKQLVLHLADFMRFGKFNRALMLDAVLLADDLNSDREIKDRLDHPRRDPQDILAKVSQP